MKQAIFLLVALVFSSGLVYGQGVELIEEANVMEVEKDGDMFSVTLLHDDEGENGYANWWQVETLTGERIARRELLHSHGTENFTRSERVDLPEGVSKVVIRGHDQSHGYGGQVMTYNLENGKKQVISQGSKAESFSNDTEDNIDSSESSDNGLLFYFQKILESLVF